MIKPAELPSEFHPGLTMTRLRLVAELIVNARRAVAARREKDDDAWALGCRGNAWVRGALMRASEEYDWLEVTDPSLHFVFAVGGAPLRFYRGEAERTPAHYLRQTYDELRVHQLAFDLGDPQPGLMRLAVELNDVGLVSIVTLVRVSEDGTVLSQWRVWVEQTEVATPLRGAIPIELPRPRLRVIDSEADTAEGMGAE